MPLPSFLSPRPRPPEHTKAAEEEEEAQELSLPLEATGPQESFVSCVSSSEWADARAAPGGSPLPFAQQQQQGKGSHAASAALPSSLSPPTRGDAATAMAMAAPDSPAASLSSSVASSEAGLNISPLISALDRDEGEWVLLSSGDGGSGSNDHALPPPLSPASSVGSALSFSTALGVEEEEEEEDEEEEEAREIVDRWGFVIRVRVPVPDPHRRVVHTKHAHTRTLLYTHAFLHTHTHTHTHTLSLSLLYTHALLYTHIHTHTYTHTYVHTGG